MAVTIRPKFTAAGLRALVEDRLKRVEAALIQRLQRVGETFVANARSNGTYTDRTGNLRNSIGYVILKNGVQIGEELTEAGESEAQAAARKALRDAIGRYPRGLVLIVVAGMDYAAAVESKGKDVLTASSKIAETQLKEALARIARKMEDMK